MRILVVGSSGYIGTALYDLLEKRGHEVLGTSTKGAPYLTLNVENFAECVQFFSRETFDVAINLSGRGITAGTAEMSEMHKVNFEGARNLSEALVNSPNAADRMIHVSSSLEPAPGTDAESEYSRSKSLGSKVVREILDQAGIQFATVALNSTYGRGQPRGRFISDMIANLRVGNPFQLRHPERVRDFCFIDDVVSMLTTVIESAPVGDNFEIGTGRAVPLMDVAKMACDFLDVPQSLVEVERIPVKDPHNYLIADTKKSRFLKCGTNLEHGIQMVIREKS